MASSVAWTVAAGASTASLGAVHNLLAIGVDWRWKRDKDIAEPLPNTPVSAKTERDAACESFQLMRKQWRVGSDATMIEPRSTS
jgi:hypothetical protein